MVIYRGKRTLEELRGFLEREMEKASRDRIEVGTLNQQLSWTQTTLRVLDVFDSNAQCACACTCVCVRVCVHVCFYVCVCVQEEQERKEYIEAQKAAEIKEEL